MKNSNEIFHPIIEDQLSIRNYEIQSFAKTVFLGSKLSEKNTPKSTTKDES